MADITISCSRTTVRKLWSLRQSLYVRPFWRGLCTQQILKEKAASKKRPAYSLDEEGKEIFDGLVNMHRGSLARAITLVESLNPSKRHRGQCLLSAALKHLKQGNAFPNGQKSSFRLGFTGPPGAGKSTFIEALGKDLTARNHRLAVLAVDPSSSRTGGSLLGDKTRMTELSRDPAAYIRPSPSSGTLGGVTRSTNEAIVLCEGAGYDTIIVETMGVGQSEFAVANMVDMFVLILPPAGGDELQGIKRGIVEMADLVLINKADGELLIPAKRIQTEYISALKFMKRKRKFWTPEVLRMSSVTGFGLPEVWDNMTEFFNVSYEEGHLEKQRSEQHKIWMWNHISYTILEKFRSHPLVIERMRDLEKKVADGDITPGLAADILLSRFLTSIH